MTSPSDPTAASAAPTEAAVAAREKIIRAAQGALKRYRVMAYVTGVMLLVLVVEMAMKYVFKVDDDVMRYVTWIPYAHGWIYVVYLVTVVDLWSKMRWTVGRLVVMVLGGVVPVMSFLVEKRVHADAEARVAQARTV
jgi:integral membrane protein